MDVAVWIYLYLTVGKLLSVATAIVSVVFIAWVVVTLCSGFISDFGTNDSTIFKSERDCYLAFSKKAKPVCILFISVMAISSFYPSKEDIGWIVGGSVAAGVATSEEAKKLPDNVISAANSFLEGISDEKEAKAE